jgi:hypothetical protein
VALRRRSAEVVRVRRIQVRLDAVDVDELRELLVTAWRMRVPKKVGDAHPTPDEPRGGP